MLFQATLIADLIAMATTLWMAFYLFARGFPSRVTLRVVIALLALSAFYFSAFNNVFHQTPGLAAWRAVFLVFGLGSWYSLTYQLMSESSQRRFRWIMRGIYLLAILAILFLLQPGAFMKEEGNALYVAHMSGGAPYIVYSIYQVVIAIFILFNLLVDDRIGLTARGKYFLAASIFPALSVLYGVASLRLPSSPRIVQDLMAFCGIFVLGLSVARHQTWTERRTSLQDFPLTTLSALGLAAITASFALREGMSLARMSDVVVFIVLAVGIYDLTREFLDRLRSRRESEFRKQLHHLESESFGEPTLPKYIQKGLDLLCETLDAQGGFVAVRRGDRFAVTTTKTSVPVESQFLESQLACEDISRPKDMALKSIAWIAPSFEGQKQVAVVGIEPPNSRMDYSTGNLELLAEVADQIGTIVSLGTMQQKQNEPLKERVTEPQTNVNELSSASGQLMDALATHPDEGFVKLVEDALRHYADYIALGQSSLADWAGIKGESHIERGKQLQAFLAESIDSFCPSGKRPHEPLPRVWYNYVVLYDAYVEGVPNREIMARLYISEGTFNRTRRNALRSLARSLTEKGKPIKAS